MNSKLLKNWFIASRPWTYTAAVIPVVLGFMLAYFQVGNFRWGLFLLTLLGGVALQGTANFLNTYGDYISGVDSVENASCPQIIQGTISPKAMLTAGIISTLIGICAGLYPVYRGGIPVLLCGAIGVVGAICYTTCLPYKYVGLGSIFVFFLMGPLMVIPSFYIQGGSDWMIPAIGSLPISFLVMAILHGNELRDIEFDRKSGIKTFAMNLGLKRSILLYKLLFACGYISLVILVCCSIYPIGALLSFAILPLILRNLRKLRIDTDSETIRWLAKKTGKFHFLFGMLTILGMFLSFKFLHL